MMATPIFIAQNAKSHNCTVAAAYNAAEEAYGDAQRAIYQEGDAANCETVEELDNLLRDHAERIAHAFETALRDDTDHGNTEFDAAWKVIDTMQGLVKEALEDEVPSNVKSDLNW